MDTFGIKKLGFGLMRLPLEEESNNANINLPAFTEMADYYMEQGFTYFDTGYPYHAGASETAAREAIVKRYPREAFMLADKMPVWEVTNRSDYQKLFDRQLERCGVEYFDCYLLHNLGEKHYADTLKHNGFSFMQKLKETGKVRRIGFSFHDKAEVLERILTEHPEMEFVQLQINYIDWDNESIESRKCYETAVRHGKPVIVMEPVKGGSLSKIPEEASKLFQSFDPDRSAASWAIRFAASLDNVWMVLSGMSNFSQLSDNIETMRDFKPLSEKERAIIGQVTTVMNRSIAIPCTACNYCVDGCPQQIPIPQYFSLYNNQHLFGKVPLHLAYYMNLTQKNGKASHCIACGQCEEHCPQHIAIVEKIKEVATIFDR